MSDDPYRESAAAYVIGSLDTDARHEFETHLADCAQCQRDVVEFSALPSLLSRVEPDDLEDVAPLDLTEGIIETVRSDQAAVRRSRLRWRAAAVGAAAALVVAVIAVVAVGDDADPGRIASPDEVLVVSSSYALDGSISLTAQPWGTLILVDLLEAPHRDEYSMWTVTADGTWTEIGTWTWSEDGTCRVPGASSLSLAAIDRVVVTGVGDPTDELAVGA